MRAQDMKLWIYQLIGDFFWENGLTDNFISVSLQRENIEDLLVYLKAVKGILSEKDPEVQSRI